MRLSELAAYAREKYNIAEQRRWAEFPGFSVLVDPNTGKWAALLMRQWDADSGREIELCDIKCGQQVLSEFKSPCLSLPYRMNGYKWIGVRMDDDTDTALVLRLFDRALGYGEQRGFTVVLEDRTASGRSQYQDTPLSFADRSSGERRVTVSAAIHKAVELIKSVVNPDPAGKKGLDRIRQMRQMYVYGGSRQDECRIFCKQGKFMEDYEDDVPWQGNFQKYFPTYHDLRLEQLRGYFTWRAAVRRGEFRPVPTSLAYIYVYELLNGIGAADVEDRLRKLREFEIGYLDSGAGDPSMRKNLRRWMPELAIVNGLPPEKVRPYADPEVLRWDEAMSVLRKPADHTDEEVFQALNHIGGGRLTASPVAEKHGEEGKRLFAQSWREALKTHREGGRTLFTSCFGEQRALRWRPLENALYYQPKAPPDTVCQLTECRRYTYRAGVWKEQGYQKANYNKKMLEGFLHEADRRLREYLKTGRALKEKPEEAWAAPYIETVVEADRRRKAEEARPKVTIRFDDLERIRQDALATRDSLLTEEDRQEAEVPKAPESAAEPPSVEVSAVGEAGPAAGDLPLSPRQAQILSMLLRGESVRECLAAGHDMATVVADAINEALFDALGDSAVECDGQEITLVEDYREEIAELLGG